MFLDESESLNSDQRESGAKLFTHLNMKIAEKYVYRFLNFMNFSSQNSGSEGALKGEKIHDSDYPFLNKF